MTAYLNVRYKAPTMADQFIVARTKCVEQTGRKAYAVGSIETLDGKVTVEADALYVEPVCSADCERERADDPADSASFPLVHDLQKNAYLLSNSAVKEALA